MQHMTEARHWGFPKGHPEPGETPEESACRELREETGVTDFNLIPEKKFEERYIIPNVEPQIDKTVTYFVGTAPYTAVVVPEDMTHEVCDVRWVPVGEAATLISYDSGKKLFQDVLADSEVVSHI